MGDALFLSEPAFMETVEMDVVLIRHGRSFWNSNEVKGVCTSMAGKFSMLRSFCKEGFEAFKDAPLDSLGVEQAMNLQKWLYDKYHTFDERKIQLAGSGLSRAYDTLVVSTARLW